MKILTYLRKEVIIFVLLIQKILFDIYVNHKVI